MTSGDNLFKQDYGLQLKASLGGSRDTYIHIVDSFYIVSLFIYPDQTASISASIEDKAVSFDFGDDILKVFLKVLSDVKAINRLDVDNKIREQEDEPICFMFTPALILVTGMVLTCKFGKIERSSMTQEEFLPLIIVSANIVQEPVAINIVGSGVG